MQIQALLNKLSNPHWFKVPKDPDDMPIEIRPGTEGAFNLYWLMCKMPPVENFTEEFMIQNKPLWTKAYTASKIIVDGAELEDSLTVLHPNEVYDFLVKHKVDRILQGTP